MATIKEDIITYNDFIIKGFKEDKLRLVYTLISFKEIDKFYDLHSKNGESIENGRFSKNTGLVLFALGAYIGETIIKIIPETSWQIDEDDPEGEVNVSLKLPDGAILFPVQKAIKRLKNGTEDEIYAYGYTILKTYTDVEKLLENEREKIKKPWWKW